MTIPFVKFPDFTGLISGLSLQTMTWDFSPYISPGQTLQGTPTVTLTVVNGTEENPGGSQANIKFGPVIGTAQLTTTLLGTTNCAVLAQLGVFFAGQPGTAVRYRCEVSCAVTPNSIGVSDVAAGINYIDVMTP